MHAYQHAEEDRIMDDPAVHQNAKRLNSNEEDPIHKRQKVEENQ